jgi:hypothetical protein
MSRFAKIETPEQAAMARVLCNLIRDSRLIDLAVKNNNAYIAYGWEFIFVCGVDSSITPLSDFDTVVATGLQGQEEAVKGIAEILK